MIQLEPTISFSLIWLACVNMLSSFRFSFKRFTQKRCLTTTPLPYHKIHIPVLLPEVLEHLKPKDGGIYCDLTFGDGGYTKALLGNKGTLYIRLKLYIHLYYR